jgi:multisubunit Na+/H+ antiporter MnhB subunit
MIDAVIAGVVAALVAADVYLALRAEPKRPKGEYLPGWLALGIATVLVIQATIVAQVAWYLWQWGASVTWYIPDLAMGFKYDLDLIQLTGLGAAALLAPVVTYLVGRFHPLRRAKVPSPAVDAG